MPKQKAFQDLVLREMRVGQELWRWLYSEIRDAIVEGRLKPGSRLPATRAVAQQHGISRGTVVAAYNQLKMEGYTTHTSSSGTFIRLTLPARSQKQPKPGAKVSGVRMSKTLAAYQEFPLLKPSHSVGVPFRSYEPAIDLFPVELWAKVSSRVLRRAPRALYGQGESAGYLPLRRAIAEYLGRSRGVRCRDDQVLITSGAQHALDMVARFLVQSGDSVWMEDPGYSGARVAFAAAGAKLVHVPVDRDGLVVSYGLSRAPSARFVYTTPSNHFPLGVTLSGSRRLELLAWASRSGSWIVEDEYDAEYRYEGKPVASLQSLDHAGCVIYVGTFTKMLFNALRLGFVILPERLTGAFDVGRSFVDRHPPTLDQAILAEFITEGYFGQHVRSMRQAYAERLGILCDEANRYLYNVAEVESVQSGMKTVAWLKNDMTDVQAADLAMSKGIECFPLSVFTSEHRCSPGLVLGFAGCSPASIRGGIKTLAEALQRKGCRSSKTPTASGAFGGSKQWK